MQRTYASWNDEENLIDSGVLTIADRDWDYFDISQSTMDVTSYIRNLYCFTKDMGARIEIQYTKGGVTYEQAKSWFDTLHAACRPIDANAAASTIKLSTVSLDIQEGGLLEKEGMRVSVTGCVFQHGVFSNGQTVEFSFQVENTTDQNKLFGLSNQGGLLINGQYFLYEVEVKDIPAHETVDYSFVLFVDPLEPEDIHEIQIPFDLYGKTGDSYWHDVDLGYVTLKVGNN